MSPSSPPDVVTPAELARAAGVPHGSVERLLSSGGLRLLPGGYIAWRDAVRAGRYLRAELASADAEVPNHATPVLDAEIASTGDRRMPLALSSSLHAGMFLLLILVSSTGALSDTRAVRHDAVMPARLVYLATPGPGGGGGGGGLKQRTPPPAVKRQGTHTMRSPVPPPPPPVEPAPEPPKSAPPPPPAPIVAPVASLPSDAETKAGVLDSTEQTDSHGSGDGGGAGTGSGSGVGEGSGPGIGPGTGGGTGGGVYRPGSGIEPPRLLREVKAEYTEEARRRGVTGEVLFEIVVRRDGSVGDIRKLQGLGYGLDEQALDALRQWRFAPATRAGVPVDVLVEVSVEFRVR